jgi:hypothetical protein
VRFLISTHIQPHAFGLSTQQVRYQLIARIIKNCINMISRYSIDFIIIFSPVLFARVHGLHVKYLTLPALQAVMHAKNRLPSRFRGS